MLVADNGDALRWGSYPMVPFAGRVRDGRFRWNGEDVTLPPTLDGHAIHGYGHVSAWTQVGPDSLTLDLPGPWPFGGRATQRFALSADRLELELAVEAGAATMPATIGWHPWFRRQLDRGGVVELSFAARYRYARDGRHIPTGQLVDVGDGPWDDCFTELGPPPRLTWPGALALTLEHDCSHLVVYTEPEHAICVEPQTGPPDAFNMDGPAYVVEPGRPLVAHLTYRWR